MKKNVAGKTATFFLIPIFLLLFFAFPPAAFASGGGAEITILKEVPAVLPSGTWSAEVKIENSSSQTLPSGVLQARSSQSPVLSPAAINSWATGHMNLSTPVLVAKAPTFAIAPGGSETEDLEGSASAFGSEWGVRPLEFFFSTSSGQGESGYNLNSFVTLEADSGLPSLPLSLVFADPGPQSADQRGIKELVKTGEGEAFAQSAPDLPSAIAAKEKVQLIEDWRSEQSFKNASAIEQPAQVRLSALESMEGLAEKWQGPGNLPKIFVSASPLSPSQIEEAAQLGYTAVLESGGKGESVSLPEGKATLLASDALLSSLAEGSPSSMWASAEGSGAGREARLVAELAAMRGRSAPVIIQISPSSLPFLSALEGIGWIRFTTLKQDVSYPWPSAAPAQAPSAPQTSPQPALISKVHSIASLARNPADSEAWSENVGMQAAYAELCAQSQNEKVRQAGSQVLSSMSKELGEAVKISSSKSVTALSESATVPVTVKNSLPFPIEAKVRSLASNSQITILPEKSVAVGSGMEGQIDFPVQIHSSIKSRVTFWMGEFYHPITKISTQLSSHLTVTRLNVIILIIPAGLLTLFGCIRQVRRKKKNG